MAIFTNNESDNNNKNKNKLEVEHAKEQELVNNENKPQIPVNIDTSFLIQVAVVSKEPKTSVLL